MANDNTTNIERIIAKIDNDFNPDNSDWIPRVGAWCIDAMSQLDCLKTVKKKKRLQVRDRIAFSSCDLGKNISLYDDHGCKIKRAESLDNGCCGSSQDNNENQKDDIIHQLTPETIDIIKTHNKKQSDYVMQHHLQSKYPPRYNVENVYIVDGYNKPEKNWVLIDSNKIELNFDAKYIDVETESVECAESDAYGCELPVIPDNGLLIEALTLYCCYKMLTRGYPHPVMNLKASQYGTNPYYEWKTMKDQVQRSVLKQQQEASDNNDDSRDMFRSNMYIEMYDPRN